MKASGSVETGLVRLPAALGATEAVERLKSLLAQEGIELFAQIDQVAGAEKVGLSLPSFRAGTVRARRHVSTSSSVSMQAAASVRS